MDNVLFEVIEAGKVLEQILERDDGSQYRRIYDGMNILIIEIV